MKRLMVVLCVFGTMFSCNIRNTKKNADVMANRNQHFTDTTSVMIIDSVYDFGKVTDGDKVVYNYRFQNTGTKPLIIFSATASCGCTVPEKPEEPIKPGDTGFLKVIFNSDGRVGVAHKTVTVISNAYPAFPTLQLSGEVVSKE